MSMVKKYSAVGHFLHILISSSLTTSFSFPFDIPHPQHGHTCPIRRAFQPSPIPTKSLPLITRTNASHPPLTFTSLPHPRAVQEVLAETREERKREARELNLRRSSDRDSS